MGLRHADSSSDRSAHSHRVDRRPHGRARRDVDPVQRLKAVRVSTASIIGRPLGDLDVSGALGLRMEGRRKERSRDRLERSIQRQVLGRLERVVTVLVEAGLTDHATPPDLIERLRRLELGLHASGGNPQALQVLASGRRLLGDAAELAPTHLPDIVLSEGTARRGETGVPVLPHDRSGR